MKKDKGRNWWRYCIFQNGIYLKTEWVMATTSEKADAIIKKKCKDIIESGGKIFDFHNEREIL